MALDESAVLEETRKMFHIEYPIVAVAVGSYMDLRLARPNPQSDRMRKRVLLKECIVKTGRSERYSCPNTKHACEPRCNHHLDPRVSLELDYLRQSRKSGAPLNNPKRQK